jgi:hypothetical protein
MASQPTGIRVLAFAAAPAMGDGAPAEGDAPTEDDRDDTDDEVEHFVMGGSDDAHTEDDRDDADDEVEHFVSGGLEKTPKKNRNSRMHTVVGADTPSANVTTTSHSVARRVTFDNYMRLAAEQGFTPIIVRTEFQNRGILHEHALEFHPRKLEVE